MQKFLYRDAILTFPYVAPTGIMDEPTQEALKQLEQKLNQLAGTQRFTKLIYRPNSNHLMKVNDIINLQNSVKKNR